MVSLASLSAWENSRMALVLPAWMSCRRRRRRREIKPSALSFRGLSEDQNDGR